MQNASTTGVRGHTHTYRLCGLGQVTYPLCFSWFLEVKWGFLTPFTHRIFEALKNETLLGGFLFSVFVFFFNAWHIVDAQKRLFPSPQAERTRTLAH